MENVEKFGQRMREAGTPVPSVGRVVHYFSYGTPGGEFPAATPRAAIITEVDTPGKWNSDVGLCVLNPSGIFFNQHCPYGGELNPPRSGTWCWTPYVAPVHLSGVGVPADDGMGPGEGVSDGGRDMLDYEASMEAARAATPKGSVLIAKSTVTGTLHLRERIMELQTALSAIYTEQPDWEGAGSNDIAHRFESYVDTVREIARKALGS